VVAATLENRRDYDAFPAHAGIRAKDETSEGDTDIGRILRRLTIAA